jgi:uroporphyrin-III C-methyltransferase
MARIIIAGAGPGSPDLLTLAAYRALRQADVILYDRLVSDGILSLANPLAELIPVGKHEGEQERVQAEIFRLMLDRAGRGKCVLRLKGGDPMVFGRGGEELALLAEHGIEAELIPGVSSAISVPALAGIPLTFRGVATSFAIVTGHCREGGAADWERYAGVDTLVVLMGVKHRAEIAAALIAGGKSPELPAAFVEAGTTPRERIVTATLGELAAGAVEAAAPAVLVIGEVVRLRERPGQPASEAVFARAC